MADANWPLTLPRRLIAQGLRYGVKPTVHITRPEIGPARPRRRSTGTVYRIRGSILLYPMVRGVNQVETFFDFVENTIAGGSKRFNWIDPVRPPGNVDSPDFAVSDYDVEMLLVSAAEGVAGDGGARLPPGGMLVGLSLEMYR